MNNTFPTEGNLSGLSRKDFQKDINDKKTDLFILKNKKGMEVAVTNYGCAILSIMVPDKNGKYANVILGHDSIDHVINSPEPFLSTTIGRYGNRIAKGKFTLFGEEHELTINNGPNSLHGGPTGFHARVWDAIQIDESTVQFNYVSADGEEGFPGNLEVEMTYRLENEVNALTIEYRATTDKATVVNLTNHGFFNLAGISNPTPTVNNNIVTINADFRLCLLHAAHLRSPSAVPLPSGFSSPSLASTRPLRERSLACARSSAHTWRCISYLLFSLCAASRCLLARASASCAR